MTNRPATTPVVGNLSATLKALSGLWGLPANPLASATGLSRSTVQSRLAGTGASPRADEVAAYADFFGLPVEVLYLPAADAVVIAVKEFDFLARKPTRAQILAAGKAMPGGNHGGGDTSVIGDQGKRKTEWTHIMPYQDAAAA